MSSLFRPFRSIRFRLTLWFAGVFALVILSLCAFIYVGLNSALMQTIDDTLRLAAERAVSQPASPVPDNTNLIEQLSLLSLAPARLLTIKGDVLRSDVLFPSALPILRDELATAATGSARYATKDVDGVSYRSIAAPVRVNGARVAVVQVALKLDTVLNTLQQVRTLLSVVVPVSLLLASLGSWFLAGRALAPMERVRRDVETIMGDTDLSRRVSGELTQDEVGRLARTFDGLLERVQTAMGRERQFTADASHELRSPLTALKGEISVALSRDRSAGEYRASLEELNAAVDDMSRLVEDLLTLSRGGSGTSLRLEPITLVDLGELAAQVCDRLAILAEEAKVSLYVQPVPEPSVATWINADRLKLQRALNNLVHNAVRYTPAGGGVHVGVFVRDQLVCVEVKDTGIGIAPAQLPLIFERFYRTDASRTRDSGGTGLGLAITQAIVVAHHGKIEVNSRLGEGSVFRLSLPVLASM